MNPSPARACGPTRFRPRSRRGAEDRNWAIERLVSLGVALPKHTELTRPVLELQRERWRGRARNSDADVLARLTRVPGVAWVLVFLGVTGSTLALGASWLLGPST